MRVSLWLPGGVVTLLQTERGAHRAVAPVRDYEGQDVEGPSRNVRQAECDSGGA